MSTLLTIFIVSLIILSSMKRSLTIQNILIIYATTAYLFAVTHHLIMWHNALETPNTFLGAAIGGIIGGLITSIGKKITNVKLAIGSTIGMLIAIGINVTIGMIDISTQGVTLDNLFWITIIMSYNTPLLLIWFIKNRKAICSREQ